MSIVFGAWLFVYGVLLVLRLLVAGALCASLSFAIGEIFAPCVTTGRRAVSLFSLS